MARKKKTTTSETCETSRDAVGNTEKSTASEEDKDYQYCYWMFTLFGYNNEIIETIETILEHECDWWLFQEEVCPSTGRDHLQGTLKFKYRKRRNQCINLITGASWRPTMKIIKQILYCQKDKSKKPGGGRWYRGINIPEQVRTLEPYGWQLEVMDIIKSEPDVRTINWFWEPDGNVGKSSLCKYLVVHYKAIILGGKSNDMFHQLSKRHPNEIKIVIIDCSRGEFAWINYSAIEKIKNGLIFSGKYEGSQLVFNSPHVIVFANCEPEKESLSLDRWYIKKIVKGKSESLGGR